MTSEAGRAANVAVIIPTWHGYDDTVECLESLQHVTYPNVQTVVIENGSANGDEHRLKQAFPEAHIIVNQTNQGFAHACNQGIDWALDQRAGYILLLSNDTVVTPDFLTHLIDYLAATPEVGVVAPLITYYQSDRIWYAGGSLNLWTGRTRHAAIDQPLVNAPTAPARTEFATGCVLLARASVVRDIGGLDDLMFTYFEDVDFCYRARRHGYEIAVVPEAIVAHKVSAVLGQRGTNKLRPGQAFYLGRNKVIFARKHLHGLQRAAFIASTATLGLAEVLKRPAAWNSPISYMQGMFRGVWAA